MVSPELPHVNSSWGLNSSWGQTEFQVNLKTRSDPEVHGGGLDDDRRADDVAYRDRPRPVGRDSSVGREEHDRQMSGRSEQMFRRRFRLSACGRQRRRRRGAVAIHHGGRPEQAPPTLPDNSIVADYYPGKKVSHPCTY